MAREFSRKRLKEPLPSSIIQAPHMRVVPGSASSARRPRRLRVPHLIQVAACVVRCNTQRPWSTLTKSSYTNLRRKACPSSGEPLWDKRRWTSATSRGRNHDDGEWESNAVEEMGFVDGDTFELYAVQGVEGQGQNSSDCFLGQNRHSSKYCLTTPQGKGTNGKGKVVTEEHNGSEKGSWYNGWQDGREGWSRVWTCSRARARRAGLGEAAGRVASEPRVAVRVQGRGRESRGARRELRRRGPPRTEEDRLEHRRACSRRDQRGAQFRPPVHIGRSSEAHGVRGSASGRCR